MNIDASMFASPPKADMCGAMSDVRFVPIADICTAPAGNGSSGKTDGESDTEQHDKRHDVGPLPVVTTQPVNNFAVARAGKNKHRDCHADHDEADNAHSASKRQLEQIAYRAGVALR
jgi:hypothetical protein